MGKLDRNKGVRVAKRFPIVASCIAGVVLSTSVQANQTIIEFSCPYNKLVLNAIANGDDGGCFAVHEADHQDAAKEITKWGLACDTDKKLLHIYAELRAYAKTARCGDVDAAVGGAMMEAFLIPYVNTALPKLNELVAQQKDDNDTNSIEAVRRYITANRALFIDNFFAAAKKLETKIKDRYQRKPTLMPLP